MPRNSSWSRDGLIRVISSEPGLTTCLAKGCDRKSLTNVEAETEVVPSVTEVAQTPPPSSLDSI